MIILDTNVLSALMTPSLNPRPLAWLDKQPPNAVWTTAVNIFESRSGIGLLPHGRRRETLETSLDTVIVNLFGERILPFDLAAAESAAILVGARVSKGITVAARDTQIAGIVVSRRAKLATRNLKDFRDLDIELIDPWAA
jgi:predicted nucleic acid-binding protein